MAAAGISATDNSLSSPVGSAENKMSPSGVFGKNVGEDAIDAMENKKATAAEPTANNGKPITGNTCSSDATKRPVDTDAANCMSVCGGGTTDMNGDGNEEEPTASYLFRLMFGACTNGGQQPLTKKAAGSNVGQRSPQSRKSLRHSMIDDEENIARTKSYSDPNPAGGRRSGAAASSPAALLQIRSRSKSRRSSSRPRTRDVQPPAHIESRTPSFSPRISRSIVKQYSNGVASKTELCANTPDLTRQASPTPYVVSEVPQPASEESQDDADAASYCYDDGISAISAHTLEEMAKLNPESDSTTRRSRTNSKDNLPTEEGFDITISNICSSPNGANVPKGGSSPKNDNTTPSNLPSLQISKSSSDKENALGSTSSGAAQHQLVSSPLRIGNVDESGDGVGALPFRTPTQVDFSRMRSTNTNTSKTTASSNFEDAWRKDEAEFWEEEARKGGDESVDVNGFPFHRSGNSNAAVSPCRANPSSPSKCNGKDITLMKQKLLNQSRTDDLTAPTANMTLMTPNTINESSMDVSTSFSRHPHDSIPFDVSECVPNRPASPIGSNDSFAGGKRRKSRKQRLHDSLVLKGSKLMMLKQKSPLSSKEEESSAGPASEICISKDRFEVGEI